MGYKLLVPMAGRIVANNGDLPKVMTLDDKDCNEDNARACNDYGIDVFIATCRLPLGQPLLPKKNSTLKGAEVESCMAFKLRSKS